MYLSIHFGVNRMVSEKTRFTLAFNAVAECVTAVDLLHKTEAKIFKFKICLMGETKWSITNVSLNL